MSGLVKKYTHVLLLGDSLTYMSTDMHNSWVRSLEHKYQGNVKVHLNAQSGHNTMALSRILGEVVEEVLDEDNIIIIVWIGSNDMGGFERKLTQDEFANNIDFILHSLTYVFFKRQFLLGTAHTLLVTPPTWSDTTLIARTGFPEKRLLIFIYILLKNSIKFNCTFVNMKDHFQKIKDNKKKNINTYFRDSDNVHFSEKGEAYVWGLMEKYISKFINVANNIPSNNDIVNAK